MTKTGQKSWPAIFSVATLAFVGTLIETSMNVTFPTLMRTFHVSLGLTQWVTSGYLMVMALTMMCSAFLRRRFSLLTLFDGATALFVAGAALSVIASQFTVLLFGRLIQAGCAGIAIPLMVNLIFQIVPSSRIGYYMSMAGMIVNLAPAVGPAFGGAMTSFDSWRLIFYVTVPIVALVWLFGRRMLVPFSKPGQLLVFPWRQFLTLLIAFVGINMAMSQVKISWRSFGIVTVLFGISGFMLWLYNHQRHHDQTDLLNFSLFSSFRIRSAFLIYVLIQLINLGINLVIPNMVQLGQHITAFQSGLILLPGSLLVAIINPQFGKLYDHVGGRLPICGGLALMLIGVLGLIMVAGVPGVVWLILLYLFFSIGRTMAFGNVMTDTLKGSAPTNRTDLNAMFSMGQQLAGSIGSTISAILLTLPRSSNPQMTVIKNGQIVFIVFGVLILLALLAGLRLFPRKINE
ncbi:Lincomycin resistance protein lmrB [Furfurilactobacillus rossiae]|uniref:MFS transporter n=1 Tax=Furfurilactobacillus rossiae TaxID=231049 RepID=UPI0015B7F17E|nr:MFS transporter [Furfurilactobacillus rossiae]MCF6165611.1 MFS transporter [Furfurilactobacillus rossiae]QLE63426.1 Lincomycin resistance protein lmrB [Furfurilactobacillus rossiae]